MAFAAWIVAVALETAAPARPLDVARKTADEAALELRYLGEADVRKWSAAGLDEAVAIGALDESLACECELELREPLVEWLRHRGGEQALPVLQRAEARQIWPARRAIEAILVERMFATLGPCAPPSPEQVAAMRETLDDFAVIEHGAKGLRARAPTDAERDDLAYFLVAVGHVGPAIGEAGRGHGSGSTASPDAGAKTRELALAAITKAKAAGNARGVYKHATRYLESLGFPHGIDADAEQQWAWGGARYSFVARDLAGAAEILGEYELAARLYRDTNPGGGACGTSNDYRREAQLEGFIRSSEALGRCEVTVAERLMNWDGEADSPYGPARLVDAGFDLARLYRGALVTRHRDVEPAALEAALAHAGPELGRAARARLQRLGPEAWEKRVWAIEGIAAELGRPELPRLLELLDRSSPAVQARIARAIGDLEQRHQVGPCDGNSWWGFGGGSNVWERPVPALARDCPSQLDDRAADALAARLLPLLRRGDDALARTTVAALGALAAPGAQRSLRALAKSTARRMQGCGEDCDDARALDDAVREAITRYRELSHR